LSYRYLPDLTKAASRRGGFCYAFFYFFKSQFTQQNLLVKSEKASQPCMVMFAIGMLLDQAYDVGHANSASVHRGFTDYFLNLAVDAAAESSCDIHEKRERQTALVVIAQSAYVVVDHSVMMVIADGVRAVSLVVYDAAVAL
jgi:hypothetical protein